MANFTPGPWKWDGDIAGRPVFPFRGLDSADGHGVLCGTSLPNDDQETHGVLVFNAADAHLIAAAPELLEALDEMYEAAVEAMNADTDADVIPAVRRFGMVAAKARRAIDKAEGRNQ